MRSDPTTSKEEQAVPVERADEHPTFELGGNTITSLAAPSRGAHEAALFRIEVPPGGGLPAHHHDHLDVFTVEIGSGTFHIDDESFELSAGDSVGGAHRRRAPLGSRRCRRDDRRDDARGHEARARRRRLGARPALGELTAVARAYIADVTLFDGFRVRRRHGVLLDGGRIAWVGAHTQGPARHTQRPRRRRRRPHADARTRRLPRTPELRRHGRFRR